MLRAVGGGLLGTGSEVCMLRNGVSVFKFAENVCGTAQVVLNGSIENAFDKTRCLFPCLLWVRVSSFLLALSPLEEYAFHVELQD